VKIAIITCYDQVEAHTRPRVLRTGFAACEGVETIVVKNKHKGMLRYLEVPAKILAVRLRRRPDAYVITFRGYEMLPFILLIKGRKPLVFDEMVNAIEYLHEHKKLVPGSLADKLFRTCYSWLLKRCRFILADTQAHAELSAELCGIDPARYSAIPIGTDESVFSPRPETKRKGFNVYYYGVMVKLHGIEYVLDAAVELCEKYPDMTFTLGGDTGKAEAAYKAAIAKGARITYKPWYQYEEIAEYAHKADLCIGGPFGDTPQAQFVITTKTFQFIAAERPVLIGRNKVNGDFKDKVNSLVVPQGDSKAIVDAIAWVYEHPKQLRQVAKAGRQLYENQFSKQIIAEKLHNIVKEL
jgi:glycosyltransferase involved in cell wall biosynthesis